MSNQSIIEHKANMYYVEFREDYLLICQKCTYKKPVKDGKKSKASPYCKALILAILEHWTNDKRGKGTSLAVYMSIPQWVAAMYDMFGRNVVIDSLDELIGEGLISKEPYKMFGRDSFQYLLNYTEVNRRIRELSDRDPMQLTPQVHPFTNQRDQLISKRVASTSKLDASTNQRDALKSNHNIESTYIPLDSTKEESTLPTVSQPSTSHSSHDSCTHALSSVSSQSSQLERTSHDSHPCPPALQHPALSSTASQLPGRNDASHQEMQPAVATGTAESRIASTTPTPQPASEKAARKPRAMASSKPDTVQLTEEGAAVLERWQQLRNKPIPLTEGMVKAANQLGPCNPSSEDLHAIEMHCYETDKNGWYKRGVKLWDIAREYEGWQSVQEEKARVAQKQQAAAKRTMTVVGSKEQPPSTPLPVSFRSSPSHTQLKKQGVAR